MTENFKKRSQSEMPAKDFQYEEMYNMAIRNTMNWGIDGYQVPKHYFDPVKIVKEREYEQQKKVFLKARKLRVMSPEEDITLTILTKLKKACQDQTSTKSTIPGLIQNSNKRSRIVLILKGISFRKLTYFQKRNTFIDQIFKEQKLRGIPGVGRYNVEKPQDEVKKEIEEMKKKKIRQSSMALHRPCYLDHHQYLSNLYPGPGNYNPRESVEKPKFNNMKPEQWRAKHLEKKRAKSLYPDVGTYKPFPADTQTFGKMLNEQEEKKQIAQRKLWGSEDRFKDPKKSKIVNKTSIPGPGQYPLTVQWQGKEEGLKKTTKRSYLEFTTTGPCKSIYY